MRWVAVVAAISGLLLASGAQAEKQAEKPAARHIFVIANDADDYGVDRCLASNAACGTMVANAYCHSHEYAQAPRLLRSQGAYLSAYASDTSAGHD